jgi:hypothetical protein
LLTLMYTVPLDGSFTPAASCAFAKALPKVAPAHDLAGRLHLGPEDRVDPGEADERNTGVFTKTPETCRSSVSPSWASVFPTITRAAIFASGTPVAFDRYGTVRDGARIHFEDVDRLVLDRELRVHQADDLEGPGDAARVVANLIEVPLGDAVRRHDARAVAGVDAGLLDVLHDAADDDGAGRVGDAVDVELDGVLEELVDQHGPLGRRLHGRRHVAVERGHVVDDRHAPAAEHVRRTDDEREADAQRDLARFLGRGGRAARRLRDAEIPQQLREALAIFREVDRVRRRAEDLTPARCSGSASFSGVWPPY